MTTSALERNSVLRYISMNAVDKKYKVITAGNTLGIERELNTMRGITIKEIAIDYLLVRLCLYCGRSS